MAFDIFINYRTVDAAFGAAITYELLAERLGKNRGSSVVVIREPPSTTGSRTVSW